jgi:hypothetical protein
MAVGPGNAKAFPEPTRGDNGGRPDDDQDSTQTYGIDQTVPNPFGK